MLALKTNITNWIRALALAGPYRLVTYSSTGISSLGAEMKPASVEVNEIEQSWLEAKDHRAGSKVASDQWQFQLLIDFNGGEALLEQFESVLAAGPFLAANVAEGLPQVRLVLQRAEYQHPPRKEPGNGSRVEYTLLAQVAPK